MGNINTSRDWDDEMLEHESSDDDIFEQLYPADNEDGYYVVKCDERFDFGILLFKL